MTEEKKIEDNEIESNPVVEDKKGFKLEAEQPTQAKKGKRTIFKGQAHIQCTYNNTIVTISDMNGAALAWSSAGMLGFKGAKKSTPFAATKVAADVSEKVKKYGLKELMIFIKGVGGGRESTVRGLSGAGFDILSIKDITPAPHNGCRRRKPRRV
jgi:small subunit ribosomal protein S11